MPDRDLDVVIFGATGFVGKLTAEHLAANATPGTRIGLAGRNERKLREVRDSLGEPAAAWPILVADSTDEDSLADLVAKTTAVATTVGPYITYGMPLVAACAAAGTHYADLTGEVAFVRRAIDAHHGTAVKTGARIVCASGFDAMPSDLGVFELHRTVAAAGEGELMRTQMVVTDLRGGVSGGTLATMSTQFGAMRSDPRIRRLVMDPYALSPQRSAEPDRIHAEWGSERDPMAIKLDPESGRWLGPFVMSSYNTRIVRRSNALLDYAYGRDFRYTEWLGLSSGVAGLGVALGTTAATVGAVAAMMFGPTRDFITTRIPPGDGPSPKTRANGRFRCEFGARTSTGATARAVVAAHGDPGYGATAVMFGQAALSLALDGKDLPDSAGVLTPASGIGAPLVSRLRLCDFTITASLE